MERNTMKALVYHKDGHKYGLEDVPVPQIQQPGDAIVKVTLGCVCTSDLHTVRGDMDPVMKPSKITIGHEFCGEIVELGSEVDSFKIGDRVVVFPIAFCGECYPCKVGNPAMCIDGGCYGVMGPDGAQAEYVRIPGAAKAMTLIPDSLEYDDVLLLPDMLCTGYNAVNLGNFQPNDTVAVFGLGPVGICACIVAKQLFGAKQVIGVDILQDRLDATFNAGAIDIALNASKEDALQRITEITGGMGVNISIDAGGLPATLISACHAVAMGGTISSVGVFAEPVAIPMEEMCCKNVSFNMALTSGEGLEELLEAIVEGKIDTRFMLTHRGPLNDIMEGYEIFSKQKDGCIKWVYTPYER